MHHSASFSDMQYAERSSPQAAPAAPAQETLTRRQLYFSLLRCPASASCVALPGCLARLRRSARTCGLRQGVACACCLPRLSMHRLGTGYGVAGMHGHRSLQARRRRSATHDMHISFAPSTIAIHPGREGPSSVPAAYTRTLRLPDILIHLASHARRSLARPLSIARLSLSLAHPPTNQSSIEPYPGFLLSWDQSLSRSVQPIHILLPSTQPSPAQPSPHAPRHHIQQSSTPTRVEGDHPPHLNAYHCSLATTPLVTDITTRPDPTIRRPSHSPSPGPPSLSS